MNNVLLDTLPTEWKGYFINTWYQIGIQIMLVQDDNELTDLEKASIIIELLFGEEDGTIRPYPTGEELNECIKWFLNGWSHDKPSGEKQKVKLVDYDVDQWRIYADFIQIYHIDLQESDMHFWKFMGLLWNMPNKQSSFMQVVEIRNKEIDSTMSKEAQKAIKKAQKIYSLGTIEQELTTDEKSKIDDYDRKMAEIKNKKER